MKNIIHFSLDGIFPQFYFRTADLKVYYSDFLFYVYFQVFPYTVPYLYPLTNIFMTSSGYMTAAVAVNRYLDIKGAQKNKRLKNGYVQASIVLLVSACINIPRWLEFEYKEEQMAVRNLTINGSVVTIYENQISAFPTKLRESNDYVRDYTLISATVLIVILPTLIMLIR